MTRVHLVLSQKGGVGKTTLTVNLAAVANDVLAGSRSVLAPPTAETGNPVLVASIDPQASATWWSGRVDEAPFDYVQVDDAAGLSGLRQPGRTRVFLDSPGSFADESMLKAALDECDDVLVPMEPEPLGFLPTARTIREVIEPRGLPYRVVVNNWDPRDGEADLRETAQFISRNGWPVCATVIRHYKIHVRASVDGRVVTQYPKNRVAMEAREDFYRLALELGYGGRDGQGA